MNGVYYQRNRLTEDIEKQLNAEFVVLEDLLTQSDFVTLHVPLTDETKYMIGKEQFAMMKKTAYLIHTSRGKIVDDRALVDALNSGHLGGAGIDVFEQEPPPADLALLQCEQVVLTPHCADMTPEGVDLLNSGAVENVIAFLEGRIQNTVT